MKHVFSRAFWIFATLLTLIPMTAFAYQIGESSLPGAASTTGPAQPGDDGTGQGPIRLARFSYVQGSITWRPSDGADWSPATVNLPIRQGAQIWVTNGGRAEVQFDDGSLLRLGNGAVATLQTLYSDTNGEFTEIKLNEGISALELRHAHSIYQIDTPLVSINSDGPSKVRVGVDDSVEIALRSGSATVTGNAGKVVLNPGGYLDLADANASYDVGSVPSPDSWDNWNDARDREIAQNDGHLPANIALVAGGLTEYGVWHDDPRYGSVWCPTVVETGWRPYQHGRWVWVEPFGWTWVSSESWGWAPYHYGTWVSEPFGWAWVPGPARQYWCPAVVHFSEYRGAVAWCPLAPAEVQYPAALSVGFHSGNWSLFFSIGGAAVYYPHNAVYCEPRPFNNVIVNRTTSVNNVTNIYNHTTIVRNTTINRNVYLQNTAFVPANARIASGVTSASVAAFGGRGEYQPQPRAASAFFVRGRSIGAPVNGEAPVAGPQSVRPTTLGLTASRSFLPAVRPANEVIRRPVFRAPLPARVAHFAPTFAHPLNSVPARRPALPALDLSGRNPVPRPEVTARPRNAGDRARQAAETARENLGQIAPRPVPKALPLSPKVPETRLPNPPGGADSTRPVARPYHYREESGLDRRTLSVRPHPSSLRSAGARRVSHASPRPGASFKSQPGSELPRSR